MPPAVLRDRRVLPAVQVEDELVRVAEAIRFGLPCDLDPLIAAIDRLRRWRGPS